MVVRSLILLLCLSVLGTVCLETNDVTKNSEGHWQVRHLRSNSSAHSNIFTIPFNMTTTSATTKTSITPQPTATASIMTMIPGHNITQTWCYNVTNTMTFVQCTITTVYIPLTSIMVPQPIITHAMTKSHGSSNNHKSTHHPQHRPTHSSHHPTHRPSTTKHRPLHTTTSYHSKKKSDHHHTSKKQNHHHTSKNSDRHPTTKHHSSSRPHPTTVSHHSSSSHIKSSHPSTTTRQSRQSHSPTITKQASKHTPAAVGKSTERETSTESPTLKSTSTTTDLPPTITVISTTESSTTYTTTPNATESNGSSGTTTNTSATSTATNDDVLSPSVANDVTNRNLGIGLGVGIGGIAALGLAGLLLYNHRSKQQPLDLDDEQVNTRWRTQSFMGVVASVVAKLPRSGSLRSKLSTTSSMGAGVATSPGLAYTSHDSTPPPLVSEPQMDEYHHRY